MKKYSLMLISFTLVGSTAQATFSLYKAAAAFHSPISSTPEQIITVIQNICTNAFDKNACSKCFSYCNQSSNWQGTYSSNGIFYLYGSNVTVSCADNTLEPPSSPNVGEIGCYAGCAGVAANLPFIPEVKIIYTEGCTKPAAPTSNEAMSKGILFHGKHHI